MALTSATGPKISSLLPAPSNPQGELDRTSPSPPNLHTGRSQPCQGVLSFCEELLMGEAAEAQRPFPDGGLKATRPAV
jgi:hypothetical protein